jgi:D-glycero-alpha-D-manno-heptose 1-phosphate guanylyltransferase
MEAIVLCGGLGTRLQERVSDRPKILAPVNGKPFVDYQIKWLSENGVNRIIFASGYLSDRLETYLASHEWPKGPLVQISKEVESLGTGGALSLAMGSINFDEKDLCIVNGDTFHNLNLKKMLSMHHKNNSDVTMAVRYMENVSSYGCVEISNDMRINNFYIEKKHRSGYVNAGLCFIKKNILRMIPNEKCSFENDFLLQNISNIKINAYQMRGEEYFYDIGTIGRYDAITR